MNTTYLDDAMGSTSLARLVVAAIGSGRALMRAWRHRRDVAILLQADDRMLADIGLTRHDVVGALAAPVVADPSRSLVRARDDRRRSARMVQRS